MYSFQHVSILFAAHFYKRQLNTKLPIPPGSYLFNDTHPQHKTHYMCKRGPGSDYVPVIVGKWFPNRTSNPELFAKLFLLLFKPFKSTWDLRPDLKISWTDTFDSWDRNLLPLEKQDCLNRYMSNIIAMNSGMDLKNTEMDAKAQLRKEQGLDISNNRKSYFDPFDDVFNPISEDLVGQTSIDMLKTP